MAAPKFIHSNELFKALVEAGVLDSGHDVTRVVIDIRVNHVPVIHVERVGDERLLRLVRGLEGVQVERIDV